MSSTDLYAVLGVDRAASPTAIKAAFRSKAKTAHPDAGGSRTAFEHVQLAYDVLSDPERRARYDATGEIREARPGGVDSEAVAVINGIFGQILAGDAPLTRIDQVAAIQGMIAEGRSAGEKHQREVKARIAKLESLQGRFTVPDDRTNLFEGMIGGRLRESRRELEDVARRLAVLDRAKEMVAGVKFRRDEPTRPVQGNAFGAPQTQTPARDRPSSPARPTHRPTST